MLDLKERLLSFRQLLELGNAANTGKNDQFSRGVAMITKSLLVDFDRLFSPEIIKRSGRKIHPLIEKYCHKTGCPICGSPMERKNGKFGPFNGCTKFPDCRGIRDMRGKISINDELIEFLTGKLYEEKISEDSVEPRFGNLDL